jgi:riboflavin kinase/FMN adenylyltransferase
MQVIRDNPGVQILKSSVVTIGNFDGLHLGHQALIRHCKSLAGNSRPVALVSFEPLPQSWFMRARAPARLMSVRQKLDFLANKGIDLVWLMRFDRKLAELDPEKFTRSMLAETLDADDVVVGTDFRYGRDRKGNIRTLQESGQKYGFDLTTVETITVDTERASSTTIRECLAVGDLARAARLLGRPYRMQGRVIRGKQLGRQLGYPTANLRWAAHPSPLMGIFAVRARWDENEWRNGVASLGTRPAVGGEGFMIEVHLFDYSGNLYGKKMEVEFVDKLRDEADFADIDELVEQIREDERLARLSLQHYEN